MSNTNLYSASTQWANRPDDQRFLSLAELKASVQSRKRESWTAVTDTKKMSVVMTESESGNQQQLAVEVYDPSQSSVRRILPTNWAFNQLSQAANSPASYLRKLPAELAAINLQWGLENIPLRDDLLVLAQTNGSNVLRALTSTTYGRIWDIQVVEAIERVNSKNIWQIPAASYATQNPRRATTLYASDRDVFIFLVDPEHPIEVNGEQLFRGFFVWNSEVGASVFGLTTFLYRYVCDNRIIWGATEIKELKIRHTGGAPDRFAYEGAEYLTRYANETTHKMAETIKKAQAFELPAAEIKGSGWDVWLRQRGFTGTQASQAVAKAIEEEGQARSLWDIINGITASARQITFANDRVALETRAGDLLKYV